MSAAAAPADGIAPPVPARATRFWWVPLTAGVLTTVVGLAALAYPGPTLTVVGFLFGGYLVVWGVLTLVGSAGADDLPAILRMIGIVFALLATLAGAVLLARPGESVATAAVVLGLWWTIGGVLQIARGVVVAEGRAANLLWGLLGLVAGIVILAQPRIALGTLVVIVAAALVVQGVLEIVAGLQLRRLRAEAAA